MKHSIACHCTAQTGSFACLFGCSLLARPLRLGSQRVGSLCSVVSLTLPLQTPSIAWFTSNSKHWFTTSFLPPGRCRKAMLGPETLHYRDCQLAASLNGVAARAATIKQASETSGLCRAVTGYREFHTSTPSFHL